MRVRRLTSNDRDHVLRFLAPSESHSTFLVGNAIERGIDDRGGPLEGAWLGAFDEHDELRGVLAQFRGPGSWIPACEGHADVLVPAMVAAAGRPSVVIGTSARVREVLAYTPSDWRVARHQREVLMVLRWDRFHAPDDCTTEVLTSERHRDAAAIIGLLHRESELPHDAARVLAQAERLAREGRARVRIRDGVLVAISCDGASTGRFVHVTATVCLTAYRRQGHASACVADVVMRARRAGRASEGAVLFTGESNDAAIAMYERLGFVRDADWEACFFEG